MAHELGKDKAGCASRSRRPAQRLLVFRANDMRARPPVDEHGMGRMLQVVVNDPGGIASESVTQQPPAKSWWVEETDWKSMIRVKDPLGFHPEVCGRIRFKVMLQVFLNHFLRHLPDRCTKVTPRPKMPTPIPPLHRRKLFKNLVRRRPFDPSHDFGVDPTVVSPGAI